MLTSSFYARRSQKRIKTDNLTVFLRFLGFVQIKALRKMLMKFTSGLNLTNNLQAAFLNESVFSRFSLYNLAW
jgi:hypothetical protein